MAAQTVCAVFGFTKVRTVTLTPLSNRRIVPAVIGMGFGILPIKDRAGAVLNDECGFTAGTSTANSRTPRTLRTTAHFNRVLIGSFLLCIVRSWRKYT
jgi:hypothetical protein